MSTKLKIDQTIDRIVENTVKRVKLEKEAKNLEKELEELKTQDTINAIEKKQDEFFKQFSEEYKDEPLGVLRALLKTVESLIKWKPYRDLPRPRVCRVGKLLDPIRELIREGCVEIDGTTYRIVRHEPVVVEWYEGECSGYSMSYGSCYHPGQDCTPDYPARKETLTPEKVSEALHHEEKDYCGRVQWKIEGENFSVHGGKFGVCEVLKPYVAVIEKE